LLIYLLYYSSSEIVGYVDGIESPRIVGNKQQYKAFKFYLNNGNGKKIQIVAWNNDMDNIIHHIIPNHVILFIHINQFLNYYTLLLF